MINTPLNNVEKEIVQLVSNAIALLAVAGTIYPHSSFDF